MKAFLSKIWNNRWFAQLFRTKIGLLLVSFIWTAIWMAVYNNSYAEWPFWVGMLGVAYIAGLTLVMIAYGWIINPIRDYKNRKNNGK